MVQCIQRHENPSQFKSLKRQTFAINIFGTWKYKLFAYIIFKDFVSKFVFLKLLLKLCFPTIFKSHILYITKNGMLNGMKLCCMKAKTISNSENDVMYTSEVLYNNFQQHLYFQVIHHAKSAICWSSQVMQFLECHKEEKKLF